MRRITSIRVRIGTAPLSIEVVIAGEGANSTSQALARAREENGAAADEPTSSVNMTLPTSMATRLSRARPRRNRILILRSPFLSGAVAR